MSDLLGDSQLTWFLTRASGVVALALLTLSMALGIGASTRLSSARWPRFVTQGLHRNISLYVLVLLALHVVAAILDDFVRITVQESFIPFIGSYRPVYMGLGTLSSDLIIAMIVTSLMRQRIGYEAWRAVHWTAYMCWPLGIVHALGTGSDTRKAWSVWFTIACVVLVLLAFAWRIVEGWPRRALLRTSAVLVTACAVALVFTWAKQGPFAPNWSKRSGTSQSTGQK
ncbi:MAG TPA: ferric reductase-like transmembrane domain-containing protein [Mycobacteriales bacterium]|nr:ferric reductase-like transmembrane domain-containing protein [Mycobacteriales bacterium]